MIRLENVSHTVGGRQVLRNVRLTVAKGEAVCLCGPSGVGKTTLLEIAAGLSAPDTGTVRLGSQRIGCAFQDDALVPWLSALDNLLLVLSATKQQNMTTADRWLREFELPVHQKPTAMSGGMRRRLSLARAFAVQPDILLLDEPFAFLDDCWQKKTACHTEAVRQAGCAVLMVSHQERRLADIKCGIAAVDTRPITLGSE
jgi:NitT/TauT family transport system ATP-binding protein